ncbi:hypothetical protein ElyMa_000890700 [Elysia marginata]|uniref:Uncharacterized protein n=1 Tax=Elysia marginata TaxID=1093978 RepID=A0AAV4H565_9GAST|nr:hypothetical protein ElyMa_000890700 [Elysia marginata]
MECSQTLFYTTQRVRRFTSNFRNQRFLSYSCEVMRAPERVDDSAACHDCLVPLTRRLIHSRRPLSAEYSLLIQNTQQLLIPASRQGDRARVPCHSIKGEDNPPLRVLHLHAIGVTDATAKQDVEQQCSVCYVTS